MEAIRAFIAIELPEDLRRQLDTLEKEIQTRSGAAAQRAIRWVPASNMHLTLKFLGEVSTGNLEALGRMMQSEAARFGPFEMSVGGLGAFPNLHRPRVIWAGTQASDTLLQLQRGIDAGARQLGYPVEERPFSPHLTLGRISQNARPSEVTQVAEAMGQMTVGELGRFAVERIHLFRSDLRPNGAIYTSLYAYILGK